MAEQTAEPMSALQDTDMPNIVPIQDAGAPLSIAEVETGGANDWAAILVAGIVGLAAAGAYLWFYLKRLVR